VRLDVVTIFPEYLAALELSLVGRARQNGLLQLHRHDLRDFTHDKHRTVDDTPYGGGPGMVMRPEPWGEALDLILSAEPDLTPQLIVPTPTGRPFTQQTAAELAAAPWLVFACGRYEGIDTRVVQHYRERVPVAEISIGDYVLGGGEAAVLVIVEAIARLLPGVLGNERSAVEDSFASGAMAALLEAPAYTKPPRWRGLEVPAVLRSGDHARIAAWRQEQAEALTAARRPDLR
jgi:tRNA (guanine37-N1)-methyltransferase